MLNVTRILFVVEIALLVLNTVLSAVHTGEFFPKEAWLSFAENTALLLYFNLGVLFYLSGMGRAIGPVVRLHPVCRCFFHDHLFAAGRGLPRLAGKERIRRQLCV